MQWFKSAMVVSTMLGVAALSANGCSGGNKNTGDGGSDAPSGDVIVTNKDSGKDAPSQGDSSTCMGAVACEVCDVSSYKPTGQSAPIGPMSNACPTADITAFVTACGSTTGSTSACMTWQTSENTNKAACLSCIFTQDTAASWGPLVCASTGGCNLNIPGCLDMALNQVSQENSTSSGSCGDFLNADFGCQDAACSSCTGTDQTTCDNDAISNQCATYVSAFQNATPCAVLNGDAAPAAADNCSGHGTSGAFTDTDLTNFVNYFCGP